MKRVLTLLFVLLLVCPVCFAGDKKSVSQSTSAENKIRKQNFDVCVQSGKSRSYCYYLYY